VGEQCLGGVLERSCTAVGLLRSWRHGRKTAKAETAHPADYGFGVLQHASAATADMPAETPTGKDHSGKDPAAVAPGRRGGLKGGPARAKNLGKKEIREAARKAARAR
jgi:hypothetical protein